MSNVIRNNASPGGSGGAIDVEYGAGVAIVQNLIYGNFAGCGGGALAVDANRDPRTGIAAFIANNTIANDTGADTGGFSYCAAISEIYPDPGGYGSSSPAILCINNVISTSTAYPAVNCGAYQNPSLSNQPDFEYNILHNARGPFFGSFCIDVSTQDNNLATDPQFVSPSEGNFHLQPTSPAIDHGDNSVLATFQNLTGLTLSTDLDGNPRPQDTNGQGCLIDMGAYEYPGAKASCGPIATLQSSPNPSTFGQAVTFTAHLSSNSALTGDVQFSDGTTVLGTETISGAGSSTFTTTQLSVGTHIIITATYQPVGSAAGTRATVTQVVNGYITATALTTSINPANVAQNVTFTAATTSQSGTPGGTVTFTDGGSTLAMVPASSGTATYTTSALTIGSHQITATFNPSNDFAGSSATLTEIINGQPTTTSLSVTPNPATAFGTLTLASTVSSISGSPSGSVVFSANGVKLGTATLGANGQASLNIMAPTPGNYSVVATYSGNSTYQSSTSAATETILAAASVTALTTSPNPAYQGQAVSLGATVAGIAGHTPTGNVMFYDGTTLLGPATLSASGAATLSVSTLSPGTHTLTASYPGNTAYAGSTSTTVQQVILPGAFGIALTPSAITLHAGQQGTVLISLSNVGNFSGALTLSFGALPVNAAATISPVTVTMTAGRSGSASLALATSSVPLPVVARRPGGSAAVLAALFALLLPLRSRLRERLRGGLAMLLLAALLVGTSSCGGDIRIPFHTVSAGTYQVPVTATDANHNSQTAMLTLIVTP